jgi:hypothetical protein
MQGAHQSDPEKLKVCFCFRQLLSFASVKDVFHFVKPIVPIMGIKK